LEPLLNPVPFNPETDPTMKPTLLTALLLAPLAALHAAKVTVIR